MNGENAQKAEKQIWLVRHGTNLTAGAPEDFPLSDAGRAEARAIGSCLRDRNIPGPVVLLSSPERRGYETGDLIMDEVRPSVEGGGVSFRVPHLASEMGDDFFQLMLLLVSLDDPSRIEGLTHLQSVGSLILIGHRRNAFLETIGTILDLKGWFARATGRSGDEDIDVEKLADDILTEGWLENTVGEDRVLTDTFARAEARGFRLIEPRWDSIEPGRVFCEPLAAKSFTFG